jgi:beta-glucosidase
LSYTTFQYSNLALSGVTYADGDIHLTATLTLTNTGSIMGSEAVQLYVTLPPAAGCTHPPLQLKAFKKVKGLKAGASVEVVLDLDKYAVSYWDEKHSTWNVDRGIYTVRVGGSSAKEALVLSGQFEVSKPFTWNGL